jgi:hypothetical protein
MMEDSISAVLSRLAQDGVSVRWRSGKAVFTAAAEPPADVVALIDARKAEVSAFLDPNAVQRRLDAEADLLRAPRPPDIGDSAWQTALRGLKAFIANGHGDAALLLGWPRSELYDIPPVWSRDDLRGVGLSLGDSEVTEVTATRIGIRTASGAPQGFYRRPEIDYALAYRERLRLAGEDGRGAEVRLRALEAVVNIYRSHHPSVDVDTRQSESVGRHHQIQRRTTMTVTLLRRPPRVYLAGKISKYLHWRYAAIGSYALLGPDGQPFPGLEVIRAAVERAMPALRQAAWVRGQRFAEE